MKDMEKKDTQRRVITELTTTGLQAATKKLGATASRRQIRKGVSENIGFIDQLLRLTLMKNNDPDKKMQRNIELGALGVIALNSFYKGFKRKKKLWVLEGVFLTTALAGVILMLEFRYNQNQTGKTN